MIVKEESGGICISSTSLQAWPVLVARSAIVCTVRQCREIQSAINRLPTLEVLRQPQTNDVPAYADDDAAVRRHVDVQTDGGVPSWAAAAVGHFRKVADALQEPVEVAKHFRKLLASEQTTSSRICRSSESRRRRWHLLAPSPVGRRQWASDALEGYH